ncbi:MAG TPA: HAD-IA family hydrolase [Actinomycetota bacterium]|nr:HAD-IA family hydrolase [Actinomycetota bacterium]
MTERWLTFDCYGTLVDWESGLRSAFAALWPEADEDEALRAYLRVEPVIQAGSSQSYRSVLRSTLEAVADQTRRAVPAGASDALAASLPAWPVFPEVPAALEAVRGSGWKTAILSNTDPDLLEASIRSIGVPFDLTVTAADAGGYKPAHGHWDTFFARSGAGREGHVHVAASLFHDIAPAAELGLRTIWVNRAGERSDLPREAELPDLSGLPALLSEQNSGR